MPIYEYRCVENQHEFEQLQSVSAPVPDKCKFCESPVEKLVSMSSFHLKGTGWYVTDYKNKDASHKSKENGPKEAKSSSPEATKETKKTDHSSTADSSSKPSEKSPKKSESKKSE